MNGGRQPGASWLTRNLVVLTGVSLLQDAASELVYPLLPVLVTGLLAAPPVVLGVVEGVAEAAAGLTRYLAGRWSDRRGRRPFVAAGYGLAAGGKVLVAAAMAWPMVLAGRVLDRFGKGVRSAPRDALIAGSVPPEAIGRAFGFHRAGDSVGAVIGPILGLMALAATGGDVRAALWWAIPPAVGSALLTFWIREPRSPARVAPSSPAGALGSSSAAAPGGPGRGRRGPFGNPAAARQRRWRGSPLPRRFWWVTAALVVVAVVNVPDALLLLRLVDLGFDTTEVVLAYLLFTTVYAAAAYPAGALADRWPPALVYAIGLAAFGIGYLGLGLVTGGPAAYALLAVYGLFPAFTDGVGKAWVSRLVPEEHRGRAQGAYQALASLGILTAGAWAGLAWSAGAGAGTVPLLLSGACGLAAAAVMAGGWSIRRRRHASGPRRAYGRNG